MLAGGCWSLYAAGSELLQGLIPACTGRVVGDWLADVVGVLLGLADLGGGRAAPRAR